MDLETTTRYLTALRGFAQYLSTRQAGLDAGFANELITFVREIDAEIRTPGCTQSIDLPCLHLRVGDSELCGPRGRSDVFLTGVMLFVNGRLTKQDIHITVVLTPHQNLPATTGYPQLSANVSYVVRRMHFDYDEANCPDGVTAVEEKNSFGEHGSVNHFQLGGKVNGAYLRRRGGADPFVQLISNGVFSKPDRPRVPAFPSNFASLADMLLRQLCFSEYQSIFSSAAWTSKVREVERAWLLTHLKKMVDFLEREGSDTLYHVQCRETN